MERRPRLTIGYSSIDKIIEVTSLITLIILWMGTLAFYSKLPEQIPSHFDAAGVADDHSNKISIFVLPAIATVLYIGLTLLSRFPHVYNYPSQVTEENAKGMYTSAVKLIRLIKLGVIIIFSGIVFLTIRSVLTDGGGLGAWFLPVAIAVLVVPTLVYIIRSNSGLRRG